MKLNEKKNMRDTRNNTAPVLEPEAILRPEADLHCTFCFALMLKFTSRSSGPVSAKLMALQLRKSAAGFPAIYRMSESTKANKKRNRGEARLPGIAVTVTVFVHCEKRAFGIHLGLQ